MAASVNVSQSRFFGKSPINKSGVLTLHGFGIRMRVQSGHLEIEDGIDGLVHVSNLSWTTRVKHPSEVLKKGDKVKAIILAIEPDKRRLSLGVKQMQPDVWDSFFAQHRVGDIVHGKILRVANFGAFVGIAEGIEGLCHNSEAVDPNGQPMHLEPGAEFDFKIIKMNQEEKKVGLSIKAVGEEATRHEVESYKHPASSSSNSTTIGDLISWKRAGGEEMFFVSAKSRWENGKAIRGGVPISFPWFANRANDPKAPPGGQSPRGYTQYVILKCEGQTDPANIKKDEVQKQLEEFVREKKLRVVAGEVFKKLQDESQVVNVYNDPQKRLQMPGIAATINFNPPHAMSTPSAAPPMARTRLSTSSKRTSLARPAPRTARNANSFSRDVARASIRFATLPQPISSNNPTAARIVYSVDSNRPMTVSPSALTNTWKCAG